MFFKSFAFRLAALLVIAVSIPTVAIEYVTVQSMTATAKQTAVERVGRIAKYKRDLLLVRLRAQNDRARDFLMTLKSTCWRLKRIDSKCASTLLASYMNVERISAAVVQASGGFQLRAGSKPDGLLEHPPFKEGQLAQFYRLNKGQSAYLVEARAPDANSKIAISYDLDFINSMFADVAEEIGERGETFLTDSEGYFITQPRYETHDTGVNHPISVEPMKICLSGKSGEIIAIDYREIAVIHGFQPVPEIGGGCIMAHVAPEDAFKPIVALSGRIHTLGLLIALCAAFAALVLSRVYADTFTKPMKNLVERVKRAEEGDLEAPVPTAGPTEVAALGRGFRNLLEAHRKSLDAREDFVAIVSHDLKNPINALQLGISIIEIMASRVPGGGEELLKQTAPMRKSVQRMIELIDNVLDLTAIKSGQFKVQVTEQDPRTLLNEVLESFRPLCEKKNIQLVPEFGEQQTMGLFDHHRVYQTLSNLIGNALRFTPEFGMIKLQLRRQGSDILVGVIDTGPGVPIDQRALVFDRYYQVDRRSRGVGSGLGLYISREIVRAHGGKIWVEEPAGERGAAFFFTLPAAPVAPNHFEASGNLNS